MNTEWTILLGSRAQSAECDETFPRLMGTKLVPSDEMRDSIKTVTERAKN